MTESPPSSGIEDPQSIEVPASAETGHPTLGTPGAIARRAARGAAIYGGRLVAIQVIQVVSSLVLARHIAPTEYGVFALATTIVAFARYVGDLGVANSLVPRKEISEAEIETGALISLAASSGLGLAIMIAALGFGDELRISRQTAVVTAVLALPLVLDSLRYGPMLRLNRSLAFETLGAIGFAETCALYLSQLGGLLLGFGLGALVAAQVIRSMIAVALSAVVGGGIVLPRLKMRARLLIRRGIAYQAPAIVTAASGLAYPVAVTAQLGTHGLGLWAWATVLAAPVAAMLVLLHNVSMSSFARLREADPSREDDAISLVARFSMMLAAGAAGILVGAAPRMIPVIFGTRWAPAIGATQAYLIGLLPSAFATLFAAVLESRQRAPLRFIASLMAALAALALIFPLAEWEGVTGAAIAVAVAAPAIDAVILGFVIRPGVLRAAFDGIVLFAAGLAVMKLATDNTSGLPELIGASVAAVLVVCAAALAIDRPALRSVRRFLRRA